MEPFDVLVIGAGQAAIPLIFDLAKAGKRVALVEREHLGGSCVNFGCTPTKAAVASARLVHLARRGAEFGLRIPTVEVDFPAVLAAAHAIGEESRLGLEEGFVGTDNPVLIRGHARLQGRDAVGFRVQISETASSAEVQTVYAREVVLDTGTRTFVPKIDGIEDIRYIDSGNWLYHRTLPEHLILLGGGNIGLEMSQFYRRMGSRVTVVDRNDRVAQHESDAVCEVISKFLGDEGIVFELMMQVTRVRYSDGGGVIVTIQNREGVEREIAGSDLFIAIGRTPNTDDLGLDTVGAKVTSGGIVIVDDRLATNVPGLWAAGDIRGGGMFTHTSWDDYRVLASQMLGDGSRTIANRLVPYAVFIDPSLARVGLSKEEAQEAGKKIKVGRYEMSHNGHAREFRNKTGFIEVVVDAETDLVLGATALCDEAGELIHLYVDLMNAKLPYTVIRNGIYVHPTLAEGAQSATEAVSG